MLHRVKHFTSDHAPFFIVATISGVLLFTNLGNIYLWQDEAETACIARNTFKFGLPIAWDGVNLVNQVNIIEWNDDFIWTWHPWGMFYVVALSYCLFGVTAFAARFPFALAGLLSVGSLYFVAYRWTKDKLTALLAAVILAGNLQFILHCRQCRYYALTSLTMIFIVWGYWNLKRRSGFITFVLASSLLFHSCYVPFFPTMLAIALFHFGRILLSDFRLAEKLRGRGEDVGKLGRCAEPSDGKGVENQCEDRPGAKAEIVRFLVSLALIALLTAPWFFYAVELDFAKEIRGGAWAVNFLGCAGEANRSLAPLAFLFIAAMWLRRNAGKDPVTQAHWKVCCSLLLIIALNLVFIPFVAPIEPELCFRYMVGLCPLTAIILAMMFRLAIRKHLLLGCALVLIYFTTTLAGLVGDASIALLQQHTDRTGFERTVQQMKADVKSWFVGIQTPPSAASTGKLAGYCNFLYEITHDYDGPNEGIVEFLKENAKPGDYVFTSYGVPSLIFHCTYADDPLKTNWHHNAGSGTYAGQAQVSKQTSQAKGIRLMLVVQMGLLSEQHLKNLPPYTYSPNGIRELGIKQFWYVPRQVWGEWASQFIRDLAKEYEMTYKKFVIRYPNIPWGNRPDRSYHKYRTVEARRGIVVYKVKLGKKKEDKPAQ